MFLNHQILPRGQDDKLASSRLLRQERGGEEEIYPEAEIGEEEGDPHEAEQDH